VRLQHSPLDLCAACAWDRLSCLSFPPLQRIKRLVLWKECEQRGDGSEPKPGTYSISTGTYIVLVKKNKIPSIKKMTKPLKYPETRNRCRVKNHKNTKLTKNPRAIQFHQKIPLQKGSCHTWTELNTDNGEFDLQSRHWIRAQFKHLFSYFLGLSASIPSLPRQVDD